MWWVPVAMMAAGTLMQARGQLQAAETASANAARARLLGETEAMYAEAGAELESEYARAAAALEANMATEGAGLEAAYVRRAGARRKASAEFEAKALETQAGQIVAASQRDVLDIQRESRLLQSRAIALAAASGGGVSTAPTVINIVADIAKEGAYRSALAVYSGEERARTMRLQAAADRLEGAYALEAGEDEATMTELRGKVISLSARFRGDTNARMALFRGATNAHLSRLRGDATGASEDARARAARTGALGTLITGGYSIYDKYSQGGWRRPVDE